MKLYVNNKVDDVLEVNDERLARDFLDSYEYGIEWPIERRLGLWLNTVAASPSYTAEAFDELLEAVFAEKEARRAS